MSTAQVTRERIADAALRLLEREGPRAFGQVRVAREAGIAQGHLTYYFPKKVDLIAAVIERLSVNARTRLTELLGRIAELDASGRRALLFAESRAMMEDRARIRVLLGLLGEAEHEPEIARLFLEREARGQALVAALLGEGHDALDAELLVATLRGIALVGLARPDDPAHLDALLARLERWVAAPSPTPRGRGMRRGPRRS